MANKLNRRDFLKLGGLTAVSLPAIDIIGKLGNDNLLASEEVYGGFVIRQLGKGEGPYQVSEDYERFDAKNCIFGRMPTDPIIQEIIATTQPMGTPDQPGWRREDVALNAAAWTLAEYEHAGADFTDMHGGLLQLDPIDQAFLGQNPMLDGPWDHSHYTEEDLARIVKKAAKFYGASLVGIAPMDERWIYAGYSDSFGKGNGGAPIVFEDVDVTELPEGTVTVTVARQAIGAELSTKDPEALKEFFLETLRQVNPAEMPPGSPPPDAMMAMPPQQYAALLPQILGDMPAPVLTAFAAALDLGFEVSATDPSEAFRARYQEDGTMVIPRTMKWVIVLGFEMDFDGMNANPTPLGQSSSANGYSRATFTAGTLAEFVRHLGYNAVPAVNQTGLSVPMAIDAGLGELGRQGILITPKYGPRVRLAKIITDMPLATDSPIRFGVKEFCDVCGKCADNCPSQAIYFEDQTMEAMNISTNPGVMKWPLDSEKCFAGWQMSGGDCGNCIKVCPFNKPEGWLHDITRILIGASSGPIDRLLLNLDDASGYGEDNDPGKFWDQDHYVHVKP